MQQTLIIILQQFRLSRNLRKRGGCGLKFRGIFALVKGPVQFEMCIQELTSRADVFCCMRKTQFDEAFYGTEVCGVNDLLNVITIITFKGQ